MLYGLNAPTCIPFVDAKLKEMAGAPTKMQQKQAKFAIKTLRMLVNTRAAEYVVTGLLNPKSKLRPKRSQFKGSTELVF